MPATPPPDGTTNLLSDAEIIAKASAAANGKNSNNCGWELARNVPSQSKPMKHCAANWHFGLVGTRRRMDSLFRQSGLYRKKWDRADYRGDTHRDGRGADSEDVHRVEA